ncbi:hypothetical protein DID88_000724 [Monilinia fructigena]|uniref:AAA+ ATPase domain-containing protein n=1 Tax=Monilinia fructigena TaxID=38457 RepID=A0A395IP01_9HELO|nr:hypothetical protein DID88_000724 [Monilinia fructigena]
MSSLDNNLSARDNLDLKPTPDYYIGYGDHDFRYQFWRYRVTHAQSGTKSDTRSKNQSQESTQCLIINCYGFFPKEGIQKLLCDSADSRLLTKDNSKEKKTQFFEPSDIWARRFKNEHWTPIKKIPSRPLKHVFMDKTVKERIVLKFDTFYSQKDEDKKLYEELGYKHKLVCLFHGESGTGKTSTITSLAHRYQLNVCLVNLQKQNEEDLKIILHRIPESSMIVFEDIKPSTFEDYKPESNKEGISLATFLNMLDGLTSLEGSIIIMTTNYFQELHDFCPELLREGRVDEAVKFTYIDEEQAKSMFHAYTSPDTELTELVDHPDREQTTPKLEEGSKNLPATQPTEGQDPLQDSGSEQESSEESSDDVSEEQFVSMANSRQQTPVGQGEDNQLQLVLATPPSFDVAMTDPQYVAQDSITIDNPPNWAVRTHQHMSEVLHRPTSTAALRQRSEELAYAVTQKIWGTVAIFAAEEQARSQAISKLEEVAQAHQNALHEVQTELRRQKELQLLMTNWAGNKETQIKDLLAREYLDSTLLDEKFRRQADDLRAYTRDVVAELRDQQDRSQPVDADSIMRTLQERAVSKANECPRKHRENPRASLLEIQPRFRLVVAMTHSSSEARMRQNLSNEDLMLRSQARRTANTARNNFTAAQAG